jgi:hypothetical protein
MSKLREIIEMPWIIISCGFWMVLAFIRGQKIKYHQWRTRCLEAEIDHYQRMKTDLERRLSGDE